jgi:hypothetical protein
MKYTTLSLLVLTVLSMAPEAAQAQPDQRVRTAAGNAVVISRAPAVARYQRDSGRQEQTDRTTRTLKIGSTGELDVSNIAGDIVITRGGGNEATVEIVKTARGRTVEEAREMLGLVQVDVAERNGRGEIKTRYPSDEGRRNNRRNINVSVSLTITAPAGARVMAHSISGNLKSTDIKGDLTLETVSGNVDISNGGRITSAKSISGNVNILETEAEGTIEAGSISGTVAARRVTARRLSLSSISGNIVLDGVTAERVDAQSMSGNVEFQGPLARNGRYELKSHSGDVRVTVAGNTGFELDASSWSGSVRSDISLTERGSDTSNSRGRRRALHGVFGDGSAVLNLSTFSGSIVVAKR